MNHQQMEDIAMNALSNFEGNIEACTIDEIYDECYTCAFDALVNKGVDHKTAQDVAQSVAMRVAQP